jgi:hypothetical protein
LINKRAVTEKLKGDQQKSIDSFITDIQSDRDSVLSLLELNEEDTKDISRYLELIKRRREI